MTYKAGEIIIAPFLHTDLTEGKNRPALLLASLPNYPGDWLGCMITSQLRQFAEGLDIQLAEGDKDFQVYGLKVTSIIRTTRIMVLDEKRITGSIGRISKSQRAQVIANLIRWLGTQI